MMRKAGTGRVGIVCSVLLSLSACSQTPAAVAAKPVTAARPAIATATPAAAAAFAIQPGAQLPWQTLRTIDGNEVTVAPGKRQLLLFFATWCHDSQRAMTQLMASDLVRQQDLQIIGIGREEQLPALQKFRSEYKLNFALVADPDRALYHKVASKGIPQLVTVAADGTIQQVLLGEVPDAIAQLHW
ncbi:TlpA family protein disulfide reductase [Rheinheimera sp.]|uniref:TlpA family protein disulfide reductase n=1 Tax=Rheinheimera sp. TaxID=1869214 RepID=UPI003D2C97CA